MSTGTLTAGVVTTVTLDSRVDDVTVATDGDEIWFTTDGRNPDYQQDIAHRVPRARSVTVPVTGRATPTVIKLRSTGTPGYTVTGTSAAAAGGVSEADVTATVDAAVAALVAAAPAVLDTLNELAAALGDDADFAGTVTTALAGKASTADLTAHGTDTTAHTTVAANRQTDSYTLVLGDAGKVVEMNKATANDLTIPPNSDVAFPTGTILEVLQYGAGQTTIVAGAGVTIRSPGGKLKIAAQYGGASLRKIATDEWAVEGNVTT